MKGPRGGRSYYMADDRASGGRLREFDCLTCCHCGSVYILNPFRKRARGWCHSCNAYTCDGLCSVPGNCAPILKCVELAQKYPGLPTLPRGYHGELLFDRELLTEGKLYALGSVGPPVSSPPTLVTLKTGGH